MQLHSYAAVHCRNEAFQKDTRVPSKGVYHRSLPNTFQQAFRLVLDSMKQATFVYAEDSRSQIEFKPFDFLNESKSQIPTVWYPITISSTFPECTVQTRIISYECSGESALAVVQWKIRG